MYETGGNAPDGDQFTGTMQQTERNKELQGEIGQFQGETCPYITLRPDYETSIGVPAMSTTPHPSMKKVVAPRVKHHHVVHRGAMAEGQWGLW